MVTKSKLKMALAADKKTDYSKLHQKKVAKLARKGKVETGEEKKSSKKGKGEPEWEDVEEESDDEEEDDAAEGDSEDEEDEEEGNGPTEVFALSHLLFTYTNH